MTTCIDTFVTYLHQELSAILPVKLLRFDAQNALADVLDGNTLNVSLLQADNEDPNIELVVVSLDVLADNERNAWGWLSAIAEALSVSAIPEWNYAQSPTALTGSAVSWSLDDVRFRKVGATDHYVHLNSTFAIRHVR